MTRETKVGLVVAGSFLCLVGVVVASRLGRTNPEPEPNAAVAQGNPPKKEPAAKESAKVPGAAEPKKNSEAPSHVTGTHQTGTHQQESSESGKTNPPPVLPSPQTATVQPPLMPPPPEVPIGPLAVSVDATRAADQKVTDKPPDHEATLEEEQKKKVEQLRQAKAREAANNSNAFIGADATHAGGQGDGLPAAVAPNLLGLDRGATVVPVAGAQTTPDKDVSPPKDSVMPPTRAMGAKLPDPPPMPQPVEAPKKDEPAKPPLVDSAIKSDEQKKPREELPAVPPPTPPPTDANPLTSLGKAPAPKQEPVIPLPPAPTPDPKQKAPMSPPSSFSPIPSGSDVNKPVNKDLTNPTLQPMGSEVKQPLPAINVLPVPSKPMGTSLPQVKSYDIQRHICGPGDASFDDVSNRYYGSTRYGKALQQYNRVHELAGDYVKQGNFKLQPNLSVFVPPKEILETQYASYIDNRPTPVSPGGSAVTIGLPPNVSSPTQVPGNAQPIVPTTDATKSYRVGGHGQMLIEIAQQTLGDRGRWSEIYRLNPALRPEYPIPGGTEILLPANANVP